MTQRWEVNNMQIEQKYRLANVEAVNWDKDSKLEKQTTLLNAFHMNLPLTPR